MFQKVLTGWEMVFHGIGGQPLDQGNMDNAPAAPPVQTGNYEYIQTPMFPDTTLTQVPSIPVPFQDWDGYPVNVGDGSGNQGGGENSGAAFETPTSPTLYFDSNTGLYYDIGNGSGG